MADIEKVDLASENLVGDRLNKLKALMPEVFTESGIDFGKLRLELGDEVDESQERYTFMWPGKADAIRQSQMSSTATLRPRIEKSRSLDGEDGSFDSDNIYIEGDNLEVLKLLQRGYHGTYDFIYINPYCICKTGVYLKSFAFGMCGLVVERLPVAAHAGAGQPEALLLGVGLKCETFAEAMEKHPNAGKVRHFPRNPAHSTSLSAASSASSTQLIPACQA